MAKKQYLVKHEISGLTPTKRAVSNDNPRLSKNSSYAGDIVELDDKKDEKLIQFLLENDCVTSYSDEVTHTSVSKTSSVQEEI